MQVSLIQILQNVKYHVLRMDISEYVKYDTVIEVMCSLLILHVSYSHFDKVYAFGRVAIHEVYLNVK